MSHELEHHESRMLHHTSAHRALLSELETILATPRLRQQMRPSMADYVSRFLDLPRILRMLGQTLPGTPELHISRERDGGA